MIGNEDNLYYAHMRHADPRLVTIRCRAEITWPNSDGVAQCCFKEAHPGMHHCVEGTADLWFGSSKQMDAEFEMRAKLDEISG